MSENSEKNGPFIRVREVVCCCPNAGYWNEMSPELKRTYFIPHWSHERLRRHLEMMKAFGFNSIQISLAEQLAVNSGVDPVKWRENVKFMCETARDLGLRVSQFVWGTAIYDFEKNGYVTLDWHKPEERARLEEGYRFQAELAPFVQRVITHWADPGGPSCDRCTMETAIEIHNTILSTFRKINPTTRGAFSTWWDHDDKPWRGWGKAWPGYEDIGTLAADSALDENSDVAFGMSNAGCDGVTEFGTIENGELDAIVSTGRKAGIWGWYTTDDEIFPALHVRTDLLQCYFRNLPDQAHDVIGWHSVEDNCSGLNMQNLYVGAHLMQDPSLNAQALLDEFVTGFVGESNAAAVALAMRTVESVRTGSRCYNVRDTSSWEMANSKRKHPPLKQEWLDESARAAEEALGDLKTVAVSPDHKSPWPTTLSPLQFLEELKAHLEVIGRMIPFLKQATEIEQMLDDGAPAEKISTAVDGLPPVEYDPAHTAGLETMIARRKVKAFTKTLNSRNAG